nr:MAG TPA: hypothetical protein [Caudoviricetes sp.]
MLGTKILKENFNQELYSKCAVWCNNHQAKIVEYEFYYEVVDNHPTDEQIKAQKKPLLQKQITDINYKLAQLQGISLCAVSVDGVNEYDVFKDGELVTMSETEFQNYFDELSDKRSDLLQQYKELDNGTTND